MDAEKIAATVVGQMCDSCKIIDERSCGCFITVATALRSAYASGYAAALGQAAGMTETHRQSWYPSADAEAACKALYHAIRAMKPEDKS